MKIKEISELSTDELLTKKRDLRQESLHLRLQQQSGQLEQPSRLRLTAPRSRPDRDGALAARRKSCRRNRFMAEARIITSPTSTQAETATRGRAQDAHRRGGFEQHEQDDRRADGHARAARRSSARS